MITYESMLESVGSVGDGRGSHHKLDYYYLHNYLTSDYESQCTRICGRFVVGILVVLTQAPAHHDARCLMDTAHREPMAAVRRGA